jgi:hypothetical protein
MNKQIPPKPPLTPTPWTTGKPDVLTITLTPDPDITDPTIYLGIGKVAVKVSMIGPHQEVHDLIGQLQIWANERHKQVMDANPDHH